MIAIYKRELKAYFSSMQAYIYLALFVCITGVFFQLLILPMAIMILPVMY